MPSPAPPGLTLPVGRAQAAATLAAAVGARLKPAKDEEEALKKAWGLFLIFDQALEAHLRGERVSFSSDPAGLGLG